MPSQVTFVQSETGWDALTDGHAMLVRALAGPSTLEELAEAAGERDLAQVRRRLSRLVREGIVRQEGERFLASSRLVQTTRQEGLITSLARHVIPVVSLLAREPERGLAIQLDLTLSEEEQAGLRQGPVQALIDGLNELSEAPAEARSPWTFVVLGTSDVPPPRERGERLLETLKRTARQRSESELAHRAVLTCYDARFGDPEAAFALIRAKASELEAQARSPKGIPYTLVLGFGASANSDGEGR